MSKMTLTKIVGGLALGALVLTGCKSGDSDANAAGAGGDQPTSKPAEGGSSSCSGGSCSGGSCGGGG